MARMVIMLSWSSTKTLPFFLPRTFCTPAGVIMFRVGMPSSFSVYTLFFFLTWAVACVFGFLNGVFFAPALVFALGFEVDLVTALPIEGFAPLLDLIGAILECLSVGWEDFLCGAEAWKLFGPKTSKSSWLWVAPNQAPPILVLPSYPAPPASSPPALAASQLRPATPPTSQHPPDGPHNHHHVLQPSISLPQAAVAQQRDHTDGRRLRSRRTRTPLLAIPSTVANKYAQFSLGFFFFIDAAVYSKSKNGSNFNINFVDWIPGICSSLGMLVINSIDKSRLGADSFSYSGNGVAWKARLVLFLGFALLAGGLAGSVTVLVLKYLVHKVVFPALWMGVANVMANALIMTRYELDRTTGRVEMILTEPSSAVLWVAQNMEDEYTYNLAL
jgi:hypothetical protein